MNCSEFDWKGYVLGEAPPAERRRMDEHLAGCEACREEVESLGLTVLALKRLPEHEMPRRIAFVSDPVFEPSWWQRFWNSGPRLGFAAAGMLSLAIVVHGFAGRGAAQTPRGWESAVETRVAEEMAKRLPAEVEQATGRVMDERVKVEMKAALNEFSGRLDQIERTRLTDMKDARSAFETMERRFNTMYLNLARYGGD